MSEGTVIDLSRLPAPTVVEPLDYEQTLEQRKDSFLSRVPASQRPDFAETIALDSEPVAIVLQESAYRELVLRNRINEAAKANMLAFATGADLDNLVALLGVRRLTLQDELPDTRPPTPAVLESDTDLRRRAQLAIEGTTVAGSRESYRFHALSAHPQVADVYVDSPFPGEVRVAILSRSGDGSATASVVEAVSAALSAEDIRPLSDSVRVESAGIVHFEVVATLFIADGPSKAAVIDLCQRELEEYVREVKRIGQSVPLSGIYAALHQPGVTRVAITSPASDVVCAADEAAHCTGIQLRLGGQAW